MTVLASESRRHDCSRVRSTLSDHWEMGRDFMHAMGSFSFTVTIVIAGLTTIGPRVGHSSLVSMTGALI
jgi:hypothetical protein